MATTTGKYDISSINDIGQAGVVTATSRLEQKANEVRANRVNWQSYFQGQMISQEDYNFITWLDNSTPDQRKSKLKEKPNQCAKTFLTLMGHIAKDQTIQYILTMLDDLLQEDKSRVEIFKEYALKKRENVWTPFLNMLARPDGFIINQTSRIITKMACWGKNSMETNDLNYYLSWLKEQLRLPNNEFLQTVTRCLQMLLRVNEYRIAFVNIEGISIIVSVLSGKPGFQIQYQLIFCLWCMTYTSSLAEKMNSYNVIPILADILSECVKEKVIRIILATFRNMIEKPEEKEIKHNHALSMVTCKVVKQLTLLEQRKFDDADITEDIEFLSETLLESVQDLSSFDEYSTEVKSGRLEWSPVHKSEKFWRENTIRLNEKNYELLKILVKLLEVSRDPLILSVAAHDIGEYVRHYPRGKHVIEQLGGKLQVMQHLKHEDPNVRYEALLAVQKLLVHNWEYLGRQFQMQTDKSIETNIM